MHIIQDRALLERKSAYAAKVASHAAAARFASPFADVMSLGKGDYAAAAGELWHAAPAAWCSW
jgi:hypothetical protein